MRATSTTAKKMSKVKAPGVAATASSLEWCRAWMRMSKVESKGENKAISIKSECKIKNKNRNVGDNEKGKCEDKATQERAGGHQR